MANFFLVYIDESYDSHAYAYSALMIPVSEWNNVFERVRSWRKYLKEIVGIPVRHELHATDFTAGRSHPNAFRHRGCRGFCFKQAFHLIEDIANIQIINSFAENKKDHMR